MLERRRVSFFLTVVLLSVTAGCGGARQASLDATSTAPIRETPALLTVTPGRSLPPSSPVPSPTTQVSAVPSEAPSPAASPSEATAVSTSLDASAPTASPTVARPVAPAVAALPVRIVIPSLSMDVPVVEMGWRAVETADGLQSEWVIPDAAAGHHVDSAMLGEAGNVVISGHNNVYGQVFEPISQAWDNDTRVRVDAVTDRSDVLDGSPIQLYTAAGARFDYVIQEFYRLRDTGVSAAQQVANAHFMQATQDARLTLITCWPPWNNTHRLIVVARPAPRP